MSCMENGEENFLWHYDLVMMRAKGLAAFVEENWPVRRGQGISCVGSDIAIPMLVAFAAELGLKAWKYREGGESPRRTHDVAKLFEDLRNESKIRLKLASPEKCVQLLEMELNYPGISTVLNRCRNMFVHWRYSHERRVTIAETGLLFIAVRDLIEEYEADGETVYQTLGKVNEMYVKLLEEGYNES